MNRIIKWYEYIIMWSIPIIIAVSSLLYKDILNKLNIDNMFLSTYGSDLILFVATAIMYLIPLIEKLIVRSRLKQFEFVRYNHIRLSELIFVVIWLAVSIAIFLVLMLGMSIRPIYLFSVAFWNYRNLVFNQLYHLEGKIIIKNRIYYIDSEAELLDDTGDNVIVKSKDKSIEIFCSNQLVKKTVITLLNKDNKNEA